MKDQMFNADYPVQVFTSLAELTKECDSLDITEAKMFLSIPYLLKEITKEQYKAVRSVAHCENGGVSCWP